MLSKRLPVPAYDMLLKCSHAFNVLDARGAVGVTERADCFATMRALAREVTGGQRPDALSTRNLLLLRQSHFHAAPATCSASTNPHLLLAKGCAGSMA
jgi:hypothetical protein